METLSQYLSNEGIRQTEFAVRVGRTQATISRILNGEAQPSAELAAAIENETGGRVPFWTWKAFEAFKPVHSNDPVRASR